MRPRKVSIMKKYFYNAFTLIELLIVISVIIVLISLLMPALKSAKEKAREIVCKGNLKQGISMLLMYSDDYNSYLPASYNTKYFWPEILCRSDYLKWPRTGEASTLICPSFEPKVYTQTDGRFFSTYGLWHGNSSHGTYAGEGSCYYLNLRLIENDRIVLADSVTWDTPNTKQNYYLGTGNGTELTGGSLRAIHLRHGGYKVAYAAFADGTVRPVNSDWITQDARYYWRRY